jgi:glycosyltransferase involved in cell wall biosynthesis
MRPDIVVGNFAQTYGLYASMSGCRPFVLFAYGSDIVIDAHRSFLHRFITSRVIRSADLVLIDSDIQRKAVLSLGCSPGKIVTFPWVNLNDLRNVTADSHFRDLLGWHDKTVVVSVRRHEPVYAVDTLIRAIPPIVAQFRNVRFLMFGRGTETGHLMRLARQLRVEGYVHFAGAFPRDRLLRYLKDSNIYVSTSLSDGCSSSLLEAIYLGIPVVITSIPGNAEWVSNRVDGLMFDKRDSEALARAITWLLSYPDEAQRMSRMATKRVVERVKWEEATNELIRRMYNARDASLIRMETESSRTPSRTLL